MLQDNGEGSTVDPSPTFSREYEESLDRYRERLRAQPITPRQWLKDNAHLASTPEFHSTLWSLYALEYPPPRVPGFVIKDVLGEGGMGRVFLGHDSSLNRHVAIKELTETLRRGGCAAERFRLEAKILAKLEHPHIVKVHQFVSHEGHEFIAMEYLDHGSLADRMSSTMRDLFTDFLRMIAKLARAVDYAHTQKIIHRDVKPGNILFDRNDEPKLSDFGLAKDLTDPTERSYGAVVGTHHYMAPEQVEGKVPGAGTDLWALGVVLFRVFTGSYPFDGQTVPELHAAIRTALPKELPSEIPTELRRICLKCLEKDPARRYARGNDLAADLDAAAALGVGCPPMLPPPLPRRRRRRLTIIALVIALLATLGVAVPALLRHWSTGTSVVMRGQLPGPSQSIAFLEDGPFGLSEVTGDKLIVWDLRREQIAKEIEHGLQTHGGALCGVVAASPDGKQIAAIGVNPTFGCLAYVELYDARTFDKLTVVTKDERCGRALSFSPDGKRLAMEIFERGVFWGGIRGAGKSRLAIFDIEAPRWTYVPVPTALKCLAFSPDGQFIVTGSTDPSLCVWNLATRALEREVAVPQGGVDAVAFSDDGSHLYAAALATDSLSVYTAAGKHETTYATSAATGEKMTCAAFNQLSSAVTGHYDGTVVSWDLKTGEYRLFRHANAEVSALAISRHGRQALAAFTDGIVTLSQLRARSSGGN